MNAIPDNKKIIKVSTKYCCRPTMTYESGTGQLERGSVDGYYLEYYNVNLVNCLPKSIKFDPENEY